MTPSREILYTFRHNSAHERGFTWAARIHARSEMVHRVCSECGSVEHYPSGAFDVTVEGGSTYPDVLGCGAYPFLIVTDAVAATWREAGITCFHAFPVNVAEVKSRKLRDLTPPTYARVEIDGRCRIDLRASGIPVERLCPECGRVIERRPYNFAHTWQMAPGSWDGSALFRDVDLYPRRSFCTQVVMDVARQYRFTNFRFELMSQPHDPGSSGIPYLKGRSDDQS